MTWTTDKPTEEGHYWMRFVIDERRSAPRALRVLRLQEGLRVQLGTSYEPVDWWDSDVEWAGPIPVPAEADEEATPA